MHRRTWYWPVLVAAGSLLPVLPGLLPGRTLAWRDSALLHGPVRGLVVDALRGASLPLWNPYAGTGEPLLAQAMHAALHPVSVATAILTPSIDALLAALVVAAGLGAWMAARALGVRPASAAVAGFGYGASGYVLGMTANAGYLAGAATLPWVVAGLVGAATHRGAWTWGAVAVAAAGLAGDPGMMVAGIVIGSVLALVAGGGRAVRPLGAAVVVGVAGAAIQLLPTWRWIPETLRGARDLAPVAAEQWSLDLARLPELVSPGLFVGIPRSFRSPVFEAFGSPADVPFPWAPSIFVGAPLLLLASVADPANRRTRRALLALALLFLWISVGRVAGASQLLEAVPVWGSLRYWEKMVAPLTLAIALLGAIGTEGTGAEGGSRLARRSLVSAIVLALAAAVALAWPVPAASPGATYAGRLGLGLASGALSLLVLAATSALSSARHRDLAAPLAVLVLAQSAAAAPFAIHAGTWNRPGSRPPLPASRDADGPRILTPLARNFTEGAGHDDAIDRTHALQHRTGWPAANVAARIENAESYTGFGSMRAAVVRGARHLKWPLLRRLGATHVVAPEPVDEEDARELELALGPAPREVHAGPDGVKVWEVEHGERARFASAVRIARGPRDAARQLGAVLAAGSSDVVVEAPLVPGTDPGKVLSIARSGAAIEVRGTCEAACLLVLAEAWAPGWVAEIDGVRAPVYPADVVARAVPWPAGTHRMTMRYEPPEVDLGAAISAAAAGLVALGGLVEARRRRIAGGGSTGRPA